MCCAGPNNERAAAVLFVFGRRDRPFLRDGVRAVLGVRLPDADVVIIVYIVLLSGGGLVCQASQINYKFEALRGPSECVWIVPGSEACA
jgi:hypothetical protein